MTRPPAASWGRDAAWTRLRAAHPPAWVVGHCRCVADLASAMCDRAASAGHDVDRETVIAGALLHDIGRSITQDIRHATLGADLLRKDGWPDRIVLCVERHTGAGLDVEEARLAGLPAQDYTPRTLEERIVAHADNLFSAERRLSLAELEAKYQAKGLPAAWRKIEELHHALCDELDVDLETLPVASLDLA